MYILFQKVKILIKFSNNQKEISKRKKNFKKN